MFLIEGWSFSKLYLPLFNKYAGKEEVRALYKELVQVISIDPFFSLQMFPAVVSKVLFYTRQKYYNILKVKIFIRIKKIIIGEIIYPFKIYKVNIMGTDECISFFEWKEENLPNHFNFEDYQQ